MTRLPKTLPLPHARVLAGARGEGSYSRGGLKTGAGLCAGVARWTSGRDPLALRRPQLRPPEARCALQLRVTREGGSPGLGPSAGKLLGGFW